MKTTLLLALLLIGSLCSARDWSYYGADPASTKFSPLTQLHPDNIDSLRIIWRWQTPDAGLPDSEELGSLWRSTPIVIDGVLFAISPLNQVTALDAATGTELWRFDPEAWKVDHFFRGYSRGLSYWTDGEGTERILFGTSTAYLYSLDARTGQPDSAFGTEGRVDLATGLHRDVDRAFYALVSPPGIVDGVVIAGSSLVDWRSRRQDELPRLQPPGDVRGFDVRTGELLWTFHAIPHEGEVGADTWPDQAWKERGGVNVWSMMTVDPELGTVYLPFSTPETTSTAACATATICSARAWSACRRARDSDCGTSSSCITGCGTTTYRRHPCWPTSSSTVNLAKLWRR